MRPVFYRYCIHTAIIVAAILLGACSTTKNLPEGSVLYTGIKKIEIADDPKTKASDEALGEVEAALNYAPNNALLGSSSVRIPFPFGLWVYNAFAGKKGKVAKWILKTMGAKPVFVSSVNPEVRSKVAHNILREYGYFDGESSYEILPDKKNPRKAKVSYMIRMNSAYTYDSIEYGKIHHKADSLVRGYLYKSVIKKGDNFNTGRLEEERLRISSLLRDSGFYYFRPDFVLFQADTLLVPGHVSLRVAPKEGIPPSAVRLYRIGNVSVNLNGIDNEPPTDSIRYKNLTIRYEGKLWVRPSILYNNINFRPGDLYSQEKQRTTQNALARLGIFRYAEMRYTPRDTARRNDVLDLSVNTMYDLPLNGEFEINVTAKSNDQVGPGAVFGVTKNNIFGGGEVLSVRARGSYEWQTGKRVDQKSSLINSYELGVSATLTFPITFFPGYVKKERLYPATTSFRIYMDQLNRSRFFKILAFGGNVTYDFQPSRTSHHAVTPLKLTFNLLQARTATFDSITGSNPPLRRSLEDQFIPAINYTYTYDNTPVTKQGNNLWWQTSVSEAGNIVNSVYSLTGKKFGQEGKSLFGSPYAQFVKLTSEIRYNYRIDRNQRLVARLMGGAIFSYGNARFSPYSEQFYIGGANSIRAFTIRSIGPGRYRPDPDNTYAYMDQTGDFKFEANLEYRFRIFRDLYGAAFVDAGNVWLFRKNEKLAGGQLKGGYFIRDLALGTGAGLRYDLDFLVLRLDMGVALHVPYDTGKKGYYNITKFKDGLGFHLAIGYPF